MRELERFDGDTLNIILIINNDLKAAANEVFNPRNAMLISRNDGSMERFYNIQDDTMILVNTFLSMTNNNYTVEDMNEFAMCQNWHE